MQRVYLEHNGGEVDIKESGFAVLTHATAIQPNRDGSLDNSVLVHEITHGITNRMTGGGTATCLEGTESKGLGEGWSDAMVE